MIYSLKKFYSAGPWSKYGCKSSNIIIYIALVQILQNFFSSLFTLQPNKLEGLSLLDKIMIREG
jgi:hypothetical protein